MADGVDIVSDITSGDLDAGSAGTVASTPAPAGTVPANGADTVHVNATERNDAPKPASLREQLSSAFKGTDGQPTDQANSDNNNGQPRAPDGKFAPKDNTQAAPADIGTQ